MIGALLDRLMGRGGTETRAGTGESYSAAFGILPTASGQYVNARLAENLATVSACVGAVASVMSSLPAYVYVRTDTGRAEAPGHPVSRLIRRPNAHQTWADWLEMTIAQVLLHGNAVSVMEFDGRGAVMTLTPVSWGNMSASMMPSGRLAYDVVSYRAMGRGTGQIKRYFADEVFHLRDRSDDGLVGRSRISRAPNVLGNAFALQDFAGNAWRNQATPSGALEIDAALTPQQYAQLRERMERYEGTGAARRVMILDNKTKWSSISVSPEDAEVLASRRFSVEELCRLFQVPPPIVQDYTHNTFTNSAQASLWFAQFSLTPWCRKIEAEFARSVFNSNDGTHMEIDLSGLMRGDFETRWKAWEIAVKNDILDRNEVREMEGWGPRAVAGAPVV